jgi:predicted RNase H-like nuclease (RuvC/YqgF family)
MVPVDDQAVRLNRIEAKLDKITEAMTMIARVDEKLVANQARTDRLEYRLDEQESDIDGLKSVVGYNTQSVKVAERFIWILISSIVGLATYYMR